MTNERFYVSKGKIRDKQKPNDWFTVKEVCALLNKQEDLIKRQNEELKQYKQAVNDVLDSYYQKDLSPIEEILVGGIARELNLDLHYKPKKR